MVKISIYLNRRVFVIDKNIYLSYAESAQTVVKVNFIILEQIKIELARDKTYNKTVRPVKTQISLYIHLVSQGSHLSFFG